ncbi:MAG TPA: hypothetical protein VHC91_08545 [Trinickia sp.]|uniref:hypothetical protein n=1 Tax=Trinickia sp. TaxID=2571163 RepID=UPI002CA7E68F|nr:hypothetical protein [Trinickia sp.]HVW50443.1 hypothetical protein [Trinickia sp.]
MSRLRITGTTVVPIDEAADSQSPSAQQAQQAHHRHHHAQHVQKGANRSRTKRRRGADAQDGIDEAGASEELLMMLTEHLQKTSESVMCVGDRPSQEHSGSGGRNDDGNDEEEDGTQVRGMRGKRFHRGSSTPDETETARRSAEQALLDARAAQAIAQPTASSTYEALKVMLDFLALPGADVVSPARLAQVRERLVQAVEKPAGAAPQQQQSANLMLPLLLLNLTRRRTDDERARGTAILKSLLSRRRIAV